MAEQGVTRKLTAILYADVVGYSRLTGSDELSTHRAVMDALDFAHDTIKAHGGTVLRYAGDAILAEFPSVVASVDAAASVQKELAKRNEGVEESRRVRLRIGINLGEVLQDRGEIYGDGVNVAARLEALAPAGGICVSGQVAQQISGKADITFENAGTHRLKNIIDPVELWCWPADDARKLRRAAKRSLSRIVLGALTVAVIAFLTYWYFPRDEGTDVSAGPKIAVIPFEEFNSSGAEGYLSDGLTKDINSYLSRFTNLFVFAPSAVREFRNNVDCATVRKELGADFILEGTVRLSGRRMRVTTALTDARTCRQLDAPGPYDRDLEVSDVFDVQLEIATKVAAALGSADAPLFNVSLQRNIRNEAPDTLDAYECVLLSYWFYENFDPDRHRRARTCLESAVKSDPDYSLGWSRLAFSYIESKKYAIDTPPDWAELARAAANRAIDLDPDNPDAYYALGILTQMTTQDLTEFRTFAERAIELNPNDAFVLADLGTWMGYAGQWELAKKWVSRSMQLNPKHQSWMWQTWHLYYFLKGEYAKSRDMGLKMNLPNNYMVQASLTAAYAMNGEQEKAQATLAHLLELRPDYADNPRAPFVARGMPNELVEGIMEGLRKAGLEVPAKR